MLYLRIKVSAVVLSLVCAGLVTASAVSCGPGDRAADPSSPPSLSGRSVLSEEEKAQGWLQLFDGESFDGWRGIGRQDIPEGHWVIENGAIKKVAAQEIPRQADGQPIQGGDLMTVRAFEDFDLRWEWKVSPGGNSGVKYNVSEKMSMAYPPATGALGFEYQILDDDRHPDAQHPHRSASALYDLLPPEGKALNPVGEFNTARIVFRGNRGEHWLNGVKVLEFELGAPEMDVLLAKSKYRVYPGFADKRRGHIVLQDHGHTVWFRNIRLRELGPPAEGERSGG